MKLTNYFILNRSQQAWTRHPKNDSTVIDGAELEHSKESAVILYQMNFADGIVRLALAKANCQVQSCYW